MDAVQVLIVGAGPTGLMLALQLARRGVALRIIDAEPGPGLHSRAIGVHARTLEFYHQLGFADEIVAAGYKADLIRLRGRGGDLVQLNLGLMGAGLSPYPFMLAYAQDLHEPFLIGKLADLGVQVAWNTRLIGVRQDQAGVDCDLAGGDPLHVPWLCGCDGARSTVRQSLGIELEGGTEEILFYVADVALPNAVGNGMEAALDAGGLILMIPLKGGTYRLIGVVPRHLAAKPELGFADVQAPIEARLRLSVGQVNWFSTYHVHHRLAPRFAQGRVFLLGDAAHIHSPAGAQGMNTGIGDAVNLGWKLAAVIKGQAQPAILQSYEAERRPFAKKLVATTDRVFHAMIGSGLPSRFLRGIVAPALMMTVARLPIVQRAIFRTVSQIMIRYRGSALSNGQAGRVVAGDRLPWLPDADNFAPLVTMTWQAHVYGKVLPAFAAAAQAAGLAVHAFNWTAAAAQAGLARDALYLLRPDGHVGFASSGQDWALVQQYAERLGIGFAVHPV